MLKTIRCTVNGKARELSFDVRASLLEVLRAEGLTSSKQGCGVGECGACTVLLDGEAVHSCLTAAIQLEGREVTTIEGLAEMGALDIIQTCFVEELAIQCGYCTPGQVTVAKYIIEKYGEPTEEQIREELAGNICRCGTYSRHVQAIQEAASAMKGGN